MSEPIWLIRTGGMIIGPFTNEEVGARVKTREITGIDEAAKPKRGWKSVREITEFQEYLKAVEKPGDESTSTNSSEMEFTQTLTISTDPQGIDATDELTKEIVYHDVTEEISPAVRGAGNTDEIPSYGVEGSPQQRREAAAAAKPIWNIVFVVVIAFSAYIFYTAFVKGPSSRKNQSAQSANLAKKLLDQGQYRKSLDEYEKLYQEDPSEESIHIYYATLKVQLEQDTLISRKLYEGLLEGDQTSGVKALAHLGLGLTHLVDDEMGLAEFNFRESLAVNGSLYPNYLNLGLKEMRSGNWNGTLSSFQSALQLDKTQPLVLMSLVRANVEMAKLTKLPKYFEQARVYINTLLNMKSVYYQESLLFKIYLNILQKNIAGSENTLLALLDANPFITDNYRYNLFVNQQFIGWKALVSYCSEIALNLRESFYTIAFEALCYAKAKQFSLAKRTIEDAVARAPKNSLVQSVYAYILLQMGLKIEASVALVSARKHNSNPIRTLPIVMQAHFCAVEQDWQCSKKQWFEVIQRNAKDVGALTGTAQANLELGNKSAAVQFINKATTITDDYVPLRVLKAQLGP